MKIRTRIDALLALCVVSVTVMVGVTLFSSVSIHRATLGVIAAEKVNVSASDLRQIAMETAMYSDQHLRHQAQWNDQAKNTIALLDDFAPDTDEKKLAIHRIRENANLATSVYMRLLASSTTPTDLSSEERAARTARIVASLFVNSQEMLDAALELNQISRAQSATAFFVMRITITFAAALMAVAMCFVWLTVRRNMLQPLMTIEEGARRISSGDYTHRLNLVQIDEIGVLARQFDAMTVRVQQALREKEVLLKEIYHRVKNNLQVVSSLLSMQGSKAGAESRGLLEESANRVKSMALVHEQLYQSQNLSSIAWKDYAEQLLQHLRQSNGDVARRVTVRSDVDNIRLGIETAIPLGLIVNELISNAYKHAFPGNRTGEIVLRLKGLEGGAVALEVNDDGVGLPEGFDPGKVASLGMQLVVSLAQQLDSQLEIRSEHGARFSLRFVPDEYEARRLAAAI